MERDSADLIKNREIRFCSLNPRAHQAHSAVDLLAEIDGVHRAHPQTQHLLLVTYDIRRVTLAMIEEALSEVGFHLENSLMSKLKRALYYYTEDTLRANLGLEKGCIDCLELYVSRYQRRRHGCRDERPSHWRSYF